MLASLPTTEQYPSPREELPTRAVVSRDPTFIEVIIETGQSGLGGGYDSAPQKPGAFWSAYRENEITVRSARAAGRFTGVILPPNSASYEVRGEMP